MSKRELSLYGDLMSEPTRAIYCFMLMCKIPFTFKEMSLLDMEHMKPEFAEINPNHKVPALTERGADGTLFKLFESHAILRYLCESTPEVPDHWYPR